MGFLGILLIILLGMSVLNKLDNNFSFLELFSFSFLVGIGLKSLIFFMLFVIGVTPKLFILLSIDIVLIVFLNFKSLKKIKEINFKYINLKKKLTEFNIVWVICFFCVAYLLYGITRKSLYWPVIGGDSLSSFDLYAKAIAHELTFLPSLFFEKGAVGPGCAYPPLLSISFAYVYMLGFATPKIISVCFYISLAFGFYSLVKKLVNPTASIFFTLFVIATPEMIAQSAIATTNVPQAILASLGFISFFIWLELRERKYFILSILLLAFNGFTRSEGIVYIFPCIVIISYFSLWKRNVNIRLFLIFTIGILLPFVFWQLFIKFNMEIFKNILQVDGFSLSLVLDKVKLYKIYFYAKSNLAYSGYYGITSFTLLVAIIINIKNLLKKEKKELLFLGALFLAFFSYLMLIYLMNIKYDSVDNIMRHSAKRFFFGYIILMWYYISTNHITTMLFKKVEKFLTFSNK